MPDPGNLDETISGVRDGDLTALLARAEAAEGPDRELDMLIWRHLLFDPHLDAGGSPLSMPGLAYSKPPYTASLDAALTLVERMAPDALWRVGSFDGRFSARIAHYGPSGRSTLLVNTYGKTPALALLAALLKALIAQAADTSARNVPARERASNASRAATGPLPRLATDDEPSAADETAWLIEETWSGFVHYVHRDFNAAAWRAEAGRVRQISRRKQRFITKNIAEAMRFSTKEAAEDWRSEQPIWFSRGDQFQVREHMWPDPSPPVAMRHGSDANAEPSGKED